MGHNGMAQPTEDTHTGTVDWLAALAIVVQRFTERSELTLELSMNGNISRVAVPLDDDPTFTVLVDRIAEAMDAGAANGGELDGTVSLDADGNFTVAGAPDLPADLRVASHACAASRNRHRRRARQPLVAARSG